MKNNSKRILALLLAIVMCVSCVVPVFAEVDVHNHAEHSESTEVCEHAVDEKGTHLYVEGAEHLVFKNSVAATCTSQGYDLYQCVKCGAPVLKANGTDLGYGGHLWDGGDENGWTVTKAPDCVNEGSKTRKCLREECSLNAGETVAIAALGHAYGEWVPDLKADGSKYACGDENATHTKTCATCGDKVQEKIPATACEYGAPVFNLKPTCLESGEAVYTCVNCGNTKTHEVLPLDPNNNHTWVLKGEYVEAPTCGADGKGYAYCTTCRAEYDGLYTFEGTKTNDGHNFVNVEAKAPTCTEAGYEAYEACSICNEPKAPIVPVPATGHKLGEVVLATTPDCENSAMKTHYTCANGCGTYFDANGDEATVESLTIAALGHDYNDTKPTHTIPATCTTYGFEIYCCTKCGKLGDIANGEGEGIKLLPPTGHNPELKSSKAATCTEDGEEYYECACGQYNETVKLPALGHKEVSVHHDATCANPGYTVTTCERNCGEFAETIVEDADKTLNPENHDLLEKITTPATCEKTGVKLIYCPNCNFKYAEIIAVGHNFEATGAPIAPECGKPGYTPAACTYCGKESKLDEKPALEHNYQLDKNQSYVAVNCGEESYNIYVCTLCGDTEKRDVIVREHSYTGDKEIIAPVCGTPGAEYIYCNNCSEKVKVNDIAYDALNPAHHADGKPVPVCTNPDHWCYSEDGVVPGTAACDCTGTSIYRPGTCYVVGLEQYECACGVRYYVEIDGTGEGNRVTGEGHLGNITVIGLNKDATCTENGEIAGWHCDACGDSEDKVVVPALGHTYQFVEGKAPTCDEAGWEAHYICTVCNKYFSADMAAPVSDEIPAGSDEKPVLPALQHAYVWHEYVAPTCKTTGVKAHFTCDNGCNIIFDENKNPLDGATEIEIATEHTSVEHGNFVDPTCVAEGYRFNKCTECGYEFFDMYTFALGHDYIKVEAVDATCGSAGNVEHYICSACDLKFDADKNVITNVVLPALDVHFNGTENFVISCTSKPANGKYCVWCDTNYESTHNIVKNIVDATCNSEGYEAEICVDGCGYFVKSEVISPKLEHKYEWVPVVAPTAFVGGSEAYKCSLCGDVKETKDVAALGGIEFSYAIDNAIVSGAEYVNGGKIKLTIYYKAVNVDLASVAVRLNYNANTLTFVSGDFVCDAADAEGNRIFNIDSAATGGNTPGFVVVTANTFGFGEAPADKTLNGEGVFAEVYFDINKDALAGQTFAFEFDTTSELSPSKVLKADKTVVGTTFVAASDVAIKALGDIDIDTVYDLADEVEFLSVAFSGDYIAAADINQDGRIGSDDYQLLRDLLLGSITYKDMCAAAQSK